MFYGDEHSSWFGDSMMPSLLKSLDGIWNEISTTHYIYCQPNSIFNNFKYFPTVIDSKMLDTESPRNELGNILLHQILLSSLQDAIIILAPCDFVYGIGLKNLLLTHSDKYVVCPHGRMKASHAHSVREFLKNKYDNKTLAKHVYKIWKHGMVDYGKEHRCDYWRADMHGKTMDIYFKEPAPIFFKAENEIANIIQNKMKYGPTFESSWGAFETIDHEVVDYYFKINRLYSPSNTDEFMWTELTPDDKYLPMIYNECWLDSAIHFKSTPYTVRF